MIEILESQKSALNGPPFHDLDDLMGTWTEEEADEFDRILKEIRTIDPEMWE